MSHLSSSEAEMSQAVRVEREAYPEAGVDTDLAQIAFRQAEPLFKATWPPKGQPGAPWLDFRYFANVIDLGVGDLGVAFCTDGVGSKALIAQMLGRYDTIGIDCVAMNVNDLICVGAKPLSLVDYIAVESIDPHIFREIAAGLKTGASLAGVSISGGETAQLKDIIRGSKPRLGFDLVGTAIGTVNLRKILVGEDIRAGDVVIGIASNGIHSNGLSLARKVFFEDRKFSFDKPFIELGNRSIGEELLEPTFIYVREALALMENGLALKALIHITSDGLLNLSRVEADVSFVIDSLPEVPPIFALIEQLGGVDRSEMFSVYNMGVGFCVIVGREDADRALSTIASFGKKACVIGYATEEQPRTVCIPNEGLLGKAKRFCRV